MKNWKTRVAVAAVAVMAISVLGGLLAEPVWAQVRATLVRDIDAPALAPFSGAIEYSSTILNDQRLLITVPAGKRLVIEHISYYTASTTGDQFVFGALRRGQFGPLAIVLEVNAPHAAASTGFTIQDGSMPVKLYFEAGEEVWVSASHNTGSSRNFRLMAQGHYVTP